MIPNYDIIIIGGGPIGIACALEAQKAALNYLVLEKGCLVNSLYNYPANMTFFSTSERIEIGGVPFVSNNVKPNRSEALEYYRRVAVSNHLNIHLQEAVVDIRHPGDTFAVTTTHRTYHTPNVILATGFYDIPVLMHLPGENLSKVTHYYKEPHFYAMQKVVVVGASNSAVDAALETWRKGAEVTMVIRGEGIGPRVKYWVKPDIENRIKAGQIRALFETQVKEITPTEVMVSSAAGEQRLPAKQVFALTGYHPDFSFIQSLGVHLDPVTCKPSLDPNTLESNVPGIHLAGVVIGGRHTGEIFIENGRFHGKQIIQALASQRTSRQSA